MASCLLLQSVFGDLHIEPQSADEDILRTALHDATTNVPWNFGLSDCLLTGIGDRVVLLVEITLKICNLALEAQRLKDYLSAVVETHQSDDFATFRPLNKRHKILRDIVTQLRCILQMHQETWRTELLVGTAFLPSSRTAQDVNAVEDDFGHVDDLDSLDMDEDDRAEDASVRIGPVNISGPSIQANGERQNNDRQRSGQIQATCNHGIHCKKGGVDKHGNLVIFVRQSAFKKHMDKHNKPFSCTAPTCGKSFTRPDHLARHEQKFHQDPD